VVDTETIIFGIPIPSDDRVFLAIVVIHILLGLVAVVTGLAAMLSQKKKGRHSMWGKLYFISMVLIFVSVIPLTIMRWPLNNHLLVLGTLAFGSAHYGRRLVRRKDNGWSRYHTIFMGASYIFLLTAFYVDNGKNLPFWKLFPQYFFWIFPTLVGVPIILYALFKHPLNAKKPNSSSRVGSKTKI